MWVMLIAASAWGQKNIYVGDEISIVKLFWSQETLENIEERVQLVAQWVADRPIKENKLYSLMKEPTLNANSGMGAVCVKLHHNL
jgi:hypothetical protein